MSLAARMLGRSGVEVSALGYGAMELQGPPLSPAISDGDAGRLLNGVLDAGITLIDTSIDYGDSEELIGRHLASRREEFFLASKCGCAMVRGEGPSYLWPHDYTPTNVRAGVEQSLRRLRTDRLDLVQIHMTPSREQIEADGTVEELLRLRDAGKVRLIGMSGTLPHLADHIAMGVFDVFQIPYSAVQREHEQTITRAADAGAGVLIRGGTARGASSGEKSWTVQPIGTQRDEAQQRWVTSGVEELLDGMSRLEFVLRFTLSNPGLSSVIVGTGRLDHLRSNIAIAEKGPLPDELYQRAKQRLPVQ